MINREKSLWWGPPKDFATRPDERKVSWLELFYDLAYVAAISRITNYIAMHPQWNHLPIALLFFGLILWSWVNGSQYYDLHGNEGIRTRLLTFWQMLAIGAVCITLPSAFNGDNKTFSTAFACLQIMITYLWWSVGFYDRSHWKFNIYFTVNYLIAFALLVASVFMNYHQSVIIWVIVLILDITPPLTGAYTIVTVLRREGQLFSASSVIVERFGSFTIIVLAESILGIVTGIAQSGSSDVLTWTAFMIAILISFLIWSIYFDLTSDQQVKKGYQYLQYLIFLHFPLLFALCVTGACLSNLLENIHATASPDVHWMFCISLAVIMIVTLLLASIMEEEEETRSYMGPVSRSLIACAIALVLLPLVQNFLTTTQFIGCVAVLVFIPVFIGVRNWVKWKFFGQGKEDTQES